MTLLKLSLKNYKKDISLHALTSIQLSAMIIITIIMVSTILIRYRYYTPFKDVFKSNGIICFFSQFANIDSSGMMNPEKYIADEDLKTIVPEAETIISCNLGPSWIVDKNNAPANINCSMLYYDDEIIERYAPAINEGRWLKASQDARCIEGVITENNYGLRVGDTIKIQCFSKTIEDMYQDVLIVGKIPDNTKIVGYSRNSGKSNSINITSLYGTASLDAENEVLLLLSSNYLSKNTTVCQGIFGPAIITFPSTFSNEDIEIARSKLGKIKGIDAYYLSEAEKNTQIYLLEYLNNLLPIVLVLMVMIIVSGISSSAILTRREIKSLAIFYITGLQWKQCSIICFVQAFITSLVSVFFSIILFMIIQFTEFNEKFIVLLCPETIICVLTIVLLFILVSLVMPMVILAKMTPKQILTR